MSQRAPSSHRPFNIFQLGLKWFRYFLMAGNGRGHGIHSPFVYSFIREVLNDNKKYPAYNKIESLRKRLLNDKQVIEVADFGAGSGIDNRLQRSVASITRYAAKSPKLAQLLYRSVNYFKPSTIVELGTSMGITSSYLASGNPAASVYTLEGAGSVAAIAKENFESLGLKNIQLIHGNFHETLSPLLSKLKRAEFVYIDGNHRLEPTLAYFSEFLSAFDAYSIFVLDDIHWSREMETAWKTIQQHPSVTCTIDLFFLGYVFFRPEFKVPQHFTIRF
jgi:predicted O-methyltransferase YrrM